MNKKLIRTLIVLAIITLINIVLFTMANITLTSFWISWAFIHIAIIIFALIFIFSIPEQSKLLHAYSESAIVTYYLIIELITGAVLIINFAFLPVMSFIIQVLILAAFLLVFFTLKKTNKNIDRKTDEREANIQHFSTLVAAITDVKEHLDYNAPYKKVVEHTYDAITGSPAYSSQEVYEIECAVLVLISQLKDDVLANNENSIRKICSDIETKISERNRFLQLNRRKR